MFLAFLNSLPPTTSFTAILSSLLPVHPAVAPPLAYMPEHETLISRWKRVKKGLKHRCKACAFAEGLLCPSAQGIDKHQSCLLFSPPALSAQASTSIDEKHNILCLVASNRGPTCSKLAPVHVALLVLQALHGPCSWTLTCPALSYPPTLSATDQVMGYIR